MLIIAALLACEGEAVRQGELARGDLACGGGASAWSDGECGCKWSPGSLGWFSAVLLVFREVFLVF